MIQTVRKFSQPLSYYIFYSHLYKKCTIHLICKALHIGATLFSFYWCLHEIASTQLKQDVVAYSLSEFKVQY